MKNSKFSGAKIMGILRQAESGVAVTELCREHGMSNAINNFIINYLGIVRGT